MLRKAVDVTLSIGNTSGDGFSFGRSLGPYGETAVLEILSVAAYLDVLTPAEKDYAYAWSNGIVAKYVDFWHDPALRTVDMWGKGRRTDAYRGKHRILGENFSLIHQLIFTTEFWHKAGFADKRPKAGLQAWLDKTQPPFKLTWFAQGEYDRALAIYRDKRHVFSLLMVNGGASQHDNSPYYPLPFAPGLIAGVADGGAEHAQLLPKFLLADGSQLIGTAYLKNIKSQHKGRKASVSYRQDELTLLGKKAPVKDGRIKLETTYTMAPGVITRTDTYTPSAPLQVARASLDFGSFSDRATLAGTKVRFANGDVTAFEVTGLAACEVAPTKADDAWKAPAGPMKTHVSCASKDFRFDKPMTITWTIRYQ